MAYIVWESGNSRQRRRIRRMMRRYIDTLPCTAINNAMTEAARMLVCYSQGLGAEITMDEVERMLAEYERVYGKLDAGRFYGRPDYMTEIEGEFVVGIDYGTPETQGKDAE